MFGGPPPPPSKEELNQRTNETYGIVQNAVVIGAILWAAPFAVELIKGRF